MNLTKKELLVGGLIILGVFISGFYLDVAQKQTSHPAVHLTGLGIALFLGILLGSTGSLYFRNRQP